MAKVMKNFRLDEKLLDGLSEIAKEHYSGNMTAALEDLMKHGIAVFSVPEDERDLLRSCASRKSYERDGLDGVYHKHEKLMVDFFMV